VENGSIERVSVRLPPGFDPSRHHGALVKLIAQRHGDGFEIQHIDPVQRVAVATRQVAITEVTAAVRAKDSFEVRLARGTRPTDGDKVAAKLEDQHPGYYLTGFEPFLGRATLTKMSDEQARCRGASAVALGVKPWDVNVAARPDGGFRLVLPKSYVPSKHDEKLQEVAEIVGALGWFVRTDPAKLTAEIIPSAPPTFPEVLPTPMAALGADLDRTPIGLKLPRPGRELGEPLFIDWTASAHLMLAGYPGAGKRHPNRTRVPVPLSDRFPTGWATVGQLEIGDQVFSGAGDVVQVDYLSPVVNRDIYRITFSDGQVVEADAEHLWTVSTFASRGAHNPGRVARAVPAQERRRAQVTAIRSVAEQACRERVGATSGALQKMFSTGPATVYDVATKAGVPYVPGPGGFRAYAIDEFAEAWIARIENRHGTPANEQIPLLTTITTADLLANRAIPDGRTNYAVAVAGALELPDAGLPIDPYLLGAWLGDGTSRAGAITVGPVDMAWMQPSLEGAWGRPAHRVQANTSSKAMTLFFGRPDPTRCKQGHLEWRPGPLGSDVCRACLRNGGKAEYGSNSSLLELLAVLGVKQNKHIPSLYLRASRTQRLALLQGLMDTDGSIDTRGASTFTVTNPTLAEGALELVRSLGIRASTTSSDAILVLPDPENPALRIRRRTGTAYSVRFTTAQAVFRMPRKLERLPKAGSLSSASAWNFVASVEKVAPAPGRCLRVNTPSHLYLVEGFIPTHNTVTLNALIADQLASGASVAICDDVGKAIDFLWCKDFVRDHGWGCDSDRAAVATLALVYVEGQRRAKVLGESGYVNWLDMPKGQRFQPIFVVVDEVSALLVTDKIPSGVPKTHPLVQEMLESNLMKVQLASYISKIVAELRFVGVRMVLSTQVTNNNTGVPPSLKAKIGHKLLAGANPSKSARTQAFSDETAVPGVPDNVKAGGKRARGVGAADLEGQAPSVYKSYFASTQDYKAKLLALGVPTTSQPAPTASQIAKYTPSLDDDGSDDDSPPSRFDGGGWGAPDGRDAQEPHLRGAAAAAHQLRVEEQAAAARARVDADVIASLEDR
jgi:replicative DNA helicase